MNKPTYIVGDYKHSRMFNGDSRLVLGTAGIGGLWSPINETESIDTILYALDNGVKVLDTAPSYRNAQEYIGKALKRWGGQTPFISTKIGRLKADKPDEIYVDYSREGMKRSLDESLELIGTDHIDLLFLHEPQLVPLDDIDSILETLISFKDQGLVNMIGIGGNPNETFYQYIDNNIFSVVSGFLKLDACNLDALKKDIPFFHKLGIAYYAASSLHMGLLGDRFEKYTTEKPDSEWITNENVENAIKIQKIAKKHGIPLPELSLRYLFSIQEADRVVIGSENIKQIKDSLAAWKNGVLDKDLFDEISNILIQTKVV